MITNSIANVGTIIYASAYLSLLLASIGAAIVLINRRKT
ncbi:hypothetical protein HS7_16290 [Sulfolobales archaeon HS-7]|nr:hypothetical protein HS7_16290 [Sulfolobales archaeon HS-7]